MAIPQIAETPEQLLEHEERIAIQQEGCNQEIDVVRRNPTTGELTHTEKEGHS